MDSLNNLLFDFKRALTSSILVRGPQEGYEHGFSYWSYSKVNSRNEKWTIKAITTRSGDIPRKSPLFSIDRLLDKLAIE